MNNLTELPFSSIIVGTKCCYKKTERGKIYEFSIETIIRSGECRNDTTLLEFVDFIDISIRETNKTKTRSARLVHYDNRVWIMLRGDVITLVYQCNDDYGPPVLK